jgi:hypothetical protein
MKIVCLFFHKIDMKFVVGLDQNSYLNCWKLVVSGFLWWFFYSLVLMFLEMLPMGRFIILLVWLHVYGKLVLVLLVIPVGISFFRQIPRLEASNSIRNSIPTYSGFFFQDLVIPGGIPFLRWIPHSGAGNSQQYSITPVDSLSRSWWFPTK